MRKMRHNKIKQSAQGHTDSQGKEGGSRLAIHLQSQDWFSRNNVPREVQAAFEFYSRHCEMPPQHPFSPVSSLLNSNIFAES